MKDFIIYLDTVEYVDSKLPSRFCPDLSLFIFMKIQIIAVQHIHIINKKINPPPTIIIQLGTA